MLTGASDRFFAGLCTKSVGFDQYVGETTPALGYRGQGGIYVQNNLQVGTGTAYNSGDVVMIAVDLGTLNVWFGLNGTWNSGDPAAGTSPAGTLASTDTFFPAVSFRSATDQQATIRLVSADLQYTVPTGYTAWGE